MGCSETGIWITSELVIQREGEKEFRQNSINIEKYEQSWGYVKYMYLFALPSHTHTYVSTHVVPNNLKK